MTRDRETGDFGLNVAASSELPDTISRKVSLRLRQDVKMTIEAVPCCAIVYNPQHTSRKQHSAYDLAHRRDITRGWSNMPEYISYYIHK